jgi:hypothetical protein
MDEHHYKFNVLPDINSNIRMFYYCLLSICFDRESQYYEEEYAQTILTNFKSLVYSESLRLDRFNPEEIPAQYRPYYFNRTFKKILVEFMQVIQYSKGDVAGMIRRYPIIDLIMIVIVRALLGSNTIKYAAVQTELLIQYFENMFGVVINRSPILEFIGTGITIHESPVCPYVIR